MTRPISNTDKNAPTRGSWLKRLGMIVASVAVLATVCTIRHYWSAEPASAQMPGHSARRAPRTTRQPSQTRTPALPSPEKLQIVARVNGQAITRQELGHECLRHYGEEVLENTVNKRLIAMECASRRINISREEVQAEIDRMAKHFNLSVQQWYKMLKQERGINPSQYANDIVWPTLALRRLAADQLRISEAELREAYETQFGPAVKARLIACKDRKKAERIRAEVAANPDAFGRIAKDKSEDAPSACDMGWIPPIRRHGGPKEIEQVAFSMRDGEVSPVISVLDQHVILKREGGVEARNVPFDQVAPKLQHMLEERKVRGVAGQVFRALQKKAKVDYVFKDPRRRGSGIAAVLNGEKITMAQLQEECVERHGKEVLEGTINRRLIEQACKKANITITKHELADEVRRAAEVSVPPREDGSVDVEAWIKLVTEKQGISYEVYMHDTVWPSVALRKLAGDQSKLTEQDIQRGFEANFGPKSRCLAIVFGDLRLAQRIWKMARAEHQKLADVRKKQIDSGVNTQKANKVFLDTFSDFFGDLANQYSIEPGSKRLRGQVPPIQKWGGQPVLEKEAFALSPGQLSGIVGVGDKFVMLFCQGMTTPVDVDPAEGREMIKEDLREKKLRIAMGQYFQRLQDYATIDNYLAGTTQSPEKTLSSAHKIPNLRPMPVKR